MAAFEHSVQAKVTTKSLLSFQSLLYSSLVCLGKSSVMAELNS